MVSDHHTKILNFIPTDKEIYRYFPALICRLNSILEQTGNHTKLHYKIRSRINLYATYGYKKNVLPIMQVIEILILEYIMRIFSLND